MDRTARARVARGTRRPVARPSAALRRKRTGSHAKPLPRRTPLRATRLAAAFALLALPLLAGCGYHQDVPALPGGAHELTVQRIANLTDMGELDVRLRAQLERRLAQMAHVRLVAPERSSLALSIALLRLTIDRSLDPAISTERTFLYSLSGTLTLTDLRTGRPVINSEAISVQVTRLYAPTVRETPAIRDEGLNDVLARFAEVVEQRLFRTF